MLKNSRRLISIALIAILSTVTGCAQALINVGATANDGTGDSVRTAFQKINTNANSFISVSNISSLVAVSTSGSTSNAFVNGYYSANDGGGGLFRWNSTSTASTNLGTIFKSTGSTSGRWERVFDGRISVLHFGAVANYTGTYNATGTGTNSQPAFQAAADYAATTLVTNIATGYLGNKTASIFVPPGSYTLSAPTNNQPTVKLPPSVNMYADGAKMFFTIPATHMTNWYGVHVNQQGNLYGGEYIMVGDYTYSTNHYGMHYDAVRLVSSDGPSRIQRGYFRGWRGAGIRIIASWDNYIDDCNFSENCYGILTSYFGTAYQTNDIINREITGSTFDPLKTTTSTYIKNCSMGHIYYDFIVAGVDGDGASIDSGTSEGLTAASGYGINGPIVIQNSYFQYSNARIVSAGIARMTVDSCDFEECGRTTGVIYSIGYTGSTINNVSYLATGIASPDASYSSANVNTTPFPANFIYIDTLSSYSPGTISGCQVNSQYRTNMTFVNVGSGQFPTMVGNRIVTTASANMSGTSGLFGSKIGDGIDSPLIVSRSSIGVKTNSTTTLYMDVAGKLVYSTGPIVTTGSGSPESVITAVVGSIYMRTDGGATTSLYVKTSGSGNTGWTAK